MYTKRIPFKDFRGNPHTEPVAFNLTEGEVIKLLKEFKVVMDWRDSLEGPDRELSVDEVLDFYNAFESILLSAWGEPSADGLYFRKDRRYDFEQSALFAACMNMFVSEPNEVSALIKGIMPTGMEDMIKKSMANMEKLSEDEGTSEALRSKVLQLQAQLDELEKAGSNA